MRKLTTFGEGHQSPWPSSITLTAVRTSAKAEVRTETRGAVYARRVPEDTVSYGVVSDQLDAFVAGAASSGHEVPAFLVSSFLEGAHAVVDSARAGCNVVTDTASTPVEEKKARGGLPGPVPLNELSAWGAAAAGIALKVAWTQLPKWASSVVYVTLGLLGALFLPEIARSIDAMAVGLLVAGGIVYVAGALVYALQRPDPLPAVFAYQEIFHPPW